MISLVTNQRTFQNCNFYGETVVYLGTWAWVIGFLKKTSDKVKVVFRAVQLVQWLPFRRADPACPSHPSRPWSRWRWRGPRVRRAVRPVQAIPAVRGFPVRRAHPLSHWARVHLCDPVFRLEEEKVCEMIYGLE